MMMKMIRNECLKLWRQVAFRVVAIVVVCLTLISPLLYWGMNLVLAVGIGEGISLETQIKQAQETAEDYRDSDMPAEALFYDASAETKRYFLENGLEGSWKYNSYYTELFNAVQTCDCYEYLSTLEKGSDEYQQVFWSSPWWTAQNDFNARYFGYDPNADYDHFGNEKYEPDFEETDKPAAYVEFMESGGDYATLKDVDWKAYAVAAKTELDELKQIILTVSPRQFYNTFLENFANEIELTRENINMSREMLAINEDVYDSYQDKESQEAELKRYEILRQQYEIEQLELKLDRWTLLHNELEKIAEAEISPDEWQFSAVVSTLSDIKMQEIMNYPMSEDLYEYEFNFLDISSRDYREEYKDYRKRLDAERQVCADAAEMVLFGLSENLCPTELNTCGVKTDFRRSVTEGITYILIFMVVAGGTTIANEYSSGTIRLLVIRPQSRRKILASKLLALTFIGLGLVIVTSTLILLLEIILHGPGDLFDDDILFLFGKAVRLPAILKTGAMTGCSLLTMFGFFSLALFLSVWMRKSPFAIILPLMLNVVLFPFVQAVSVLLLELLPWLSYMPFVYTDLSVFFTSPLATFAGDIDILSILIGDISSQFLLIFRNAGAELWIGLLYGAFFTALFLFLSFLIFKKQQIKN